jgi:hypothetical protein
MPHVKAHRPGEHTRDGSASRPFTCLTGWGVWQYGPGLHNQQVASFSVTGSGDMRSAQPMRFSPNEAIPVSVLWSRLWRRSIAGMCRALAATRSLAWPRRRQLGRLAIRIADGTRNRQPVCARLSDGRNEFNASIVRLSLVA